MRRLLIVLCALFMTAGLAAAHDYNELTFNAAYVRHDDGNSVWAASGEAGFAAGRLRLGPAVSTVQAEGQAGDQLMVGGIAHLNFGGDEGGPFIGARGLYDFDAGDQADDYQVSARAGFNFFKGRALFRIYLEQVVAGYDESGDLTATAGFGCRF